MGAEGAHATLFAFHRGNSPRFAVCKHSRGVTSHPGGKPATRAFSLPSLQTGDSGPRPGDLSSGLRSCLWLEASLLGPVLLV